MPDSPEHPHHPGFLLKIRFGFFFFYSPLNVFLHEGSSGQIPEGFFSKPFQQGNLFSKVSRALSLWPGGKLISLSDAVQGVPLVPHPAPRWFGAVLGSGV